MKDFLLVLNPGSTSIKFSLYEVDSADIVKSELEGEIEHVGEQARFAVTSSDGRINEQQHLTIADGEHHANLIRFLLDWLRDYLHQGQLLAVGHRVVHGGPDYLAPVRIDKTVMTVLENLIPLAPLHQPQSLAIIETLQNMLPDLPQIACFDTSFHRQQPELAQMFALPRRFHNEGVHRYGFHGLSYEYISQILTDYDPGLASAKVIVAHLGNGASLCALDRLKSVATTMSFSPLDGLMMGTRCGSLDPGVILYLLQHELMSAEQISDMLYHESGLKGVSGLSHDMRVLLDSDTADAKQAVDLFIYRISREIGSLTAALGGLDALVFTAGIGQHVPQVRHGVCEQAAWLGVELDEKANNTGKTLISSSTSQVSVWVLHTNENQMIARHILALIN